MARDSNRNEDKTTSPGTGMVLPFSSGTIGKTLSSPGIRSNKKTHINCGSSARMRVTCVRTWIKNDANADGNSTPISGAYLTNPSRELVRSMVGFSTYGRFFYLARAALNPPTSLCRKLFPAIVE
ncbi:hypothetical protein [Absidia glauca]|uniref:Ndc10 domain-containing protein n=1 Tax=Absidia glauca TaxID=4829 RepID=A0A163J7Q2_ABSGL|nr:hypothetical protein [Absidia glauca]